MTTTVEKAQIAELLNEAANVLSENNWRGDLQESLRDAAATLSVDQAQVKFAAQYIAPKRIPLDPREQALWQLIDAYAKKVKTVDYWSGNVKNSSLLTPVYELWYKVRDQLIVLANKEDDYGYTVFPKTVDGRDFGKLIDDYARKADVVDFFSGAVTDKELLAPAYDAHFAVKKALYELANSNPHFTCELRP